MLLLNTKSIVDCSEDESELHFNESISIAEAIYSLPNLRCSRRLESLNVGMRNDVTHFDKVELHSFMSDLEGLDCKNGYDIILDDDNNLALMVYGSRYEFEGSVYTSLSKVTFTAMANGVVHDISNDIINAIRSAELDLTEISR